MTGPRIITFYLPQYHPIPENDKWWGEGFTDWVNVSKAKPRYKGHYQPHIPSDFGYYDLRDEKVRVFQAELAAAYGISGFCYYHYWFNGKMLLERPLNEVLESGKPDFPFCICWANENWTRSWDGMDKECLMTQDYNLYDPKQHILWLEKAFSDKRYIRVNNKPLLLVYNAGGIPGLNKIITEWRKTVKEKGHDDLYICSVISVHNKLSDQEIINLGFDAIVDFIPNGRDIPKMKLWSMPRNYLFRLYNKLIRIFGLEGRVSDLPATYVYDYPSLVKVKLNKKPGQFRKFPCVIPSWDNTARRKIVYIMQNDDEKLYKMWLEKTIESVKKYPADEQIVFINAWNEWAEGCHLEPDTRNGRKFLEATRAAIEKSAKNH